jgi:hypothetical protein
MSSLVILLPSSRNHQFLMESKQFLVSNAPLGIPASEVSSRQIVAVSGIEHFDAGAGVNNDAGQDQTANVE